MNEIVVQGQDGSTWFYHALDQSHYPPEQVGWALVIENAPEEIKPQGLTAAEVVGDLRSMQATSPPPEETVRFFTERMIETLERRAAEAEAEDRPSADARERIAGLRQELAELTDPG